jgi:multicomponent Na+:H+ antiporter subunit E
VTTPRSRSTIGVAALRGTAFFALWFVLLPSVEPPDLAVGVLATACATSASLALLPPEAGRVRFFALVALVPRFVWQSLVAGFDVARRALAPGMPLATGLVDYHTGFPRGLARNNFATITSLMPGTLPCGDGPDTIEIHCLDVGQPVGEQMADEERRLSKVLLPGDPHG